MVRLNLRRVLHPPMVADIRVTPCGSCGHINLWAERHPHPDVVRAELAAIIFERHEAEQAAHKDFIDRLRIRMRGDVDISRHSLMAEFTRQRLAAGERILREQQNRTNGGTVTN